jgi:hypothetical protein
MFSFIKDVSTFITILSVLFCIARTQPSPVKISDISIKALQGDFTEKINPFQSFKVKKKSESKLVEVSFSITPVSSTINALNLFISKRDSISAAIPSDNKISKLFSLSLSDKEKGKLRGKYFLLDSKLLIVQDNTGANYSALWASLPDKSGLSLFWIRDNLDTFTETDDIKGWHKTLRSDNLLLALLDLNIKSKIRLIFSLPAAADVKTLSLKYGGCPK